MAAEVPKLAGGAGGGGGADAGADMDGLPGEAALPSAGKAETITLSRTVSVSIEAKLQSTATGALLRRSIGTRELPVHSPFLLLDEFELASPSAGFPDHPHRDMLSGTMEHQDFCGHKEVVCHGDSQWMTCGRGIVHSESACGKEVARGLQLWINLQASDKRCEPSYQVLREADVPCVRAAGVTAHVVAGKALGAESPARTRIPMCFLDFELAPGAGLQQPIPATFSGFIYVLAGDAQFGPAEKPTTGAAHQALVLSLRPAGEGDGLRACAGDKGCRFVLVAGEPSEEAIVMHGPFACVTRDEVMEALLDFQFGRNGFERAPGWASE